jgi:hypothetical protein
MSELAVWGGRCSGVQDGKCHVSPTNQVLTSCTISNWKWVILQRDAAKLAANTAVSVICLVSARLQLPVSLTLHLHSSCCRNVYFICICLLCILRMFFILPLHPPFCILIMTNRFSYSTKSTLLIIQRLNVCQRAVWRRREGHLR